MLESLKFCECPQPDDCKACQEEDDADVEYTKQHNPFRHRYTLRIYDECEGRIEKSVPRITV